MNSQDDDLLGNPEAARILGVSEGCLNKWRVYGQGPRFVKLGRRIRYRRSDLNTFIDDRIRASTSDPGTHRAA